MVTQAPVGELSDRLWVAAEPLRSTLSLVELERLVLAIAFLRYANRQVERRREWLVLESHHRDSRWHRQTELQRAALLEQPEGYRDAGVLWVPRAARWERLEDPAGLAGLRIRLAEMAATLEDANPSLGRVLSDSLPDGSVPLDAEALGDVVDALSDPVLGTADEDPFAPFARTLWQRHGTTGLTFEGLASS